MYQNELVDRRNHENSLAEFKVSFVLCSRSPESVLWFSILNCFTEVRTLFILLFICNFLSAPRKLG